mmetsp:Transcript_3027/g.10589  ORF Transcript_3027/g.10589 Transcript_3027/m.10589 type:complete len:312 (-) Transcript_3027:493-1428(-)
MIRQNVELLELLLAVVIEAREKGAALAVVADVHSVEGEAEDVTRLAHHELAHDHANRTSERHRLRHDLVCRHAHHVASGACHVAHPCNHWLALFLRPLQLTVNRVRCRIAAAARVHAEDDCLHRLVGDRCTNVGARRVASNALSSTSNVLLSRAIVNVARRLDVGNLVLTLGERALLLCEEVLRGVEELGLGELLLDVRVDLVTILETVDKTLADRRLGREGAAEVALLHLLLADALPVGGGGHLHGEDLFEQRLGHFAVRVAQLLLLESVGEVLVLLALEETRANAALLQRALDEGHVVAGAPQREDART